MDVPERVNAAIPVFPAGFVLVKIIKLAASAVPPDAAPALLPISTPVI